MTNAERRQSIFIASQSACQNERTAQEDRARARSCQAGRQARGRAVDADSAKRTGTRLGLAEHRTRFFVLKSSHESSHFNEKVVYEKQHQPLFTR